MTACNEIFCHIYNTLCEKNALNNIFDFKRNAEYTKRIIHGEKNKNRNVLYS